MAPQLPSPARAHVCAQRSIPPLDPASHSGRHAAGSLEVTTPVSTSAKPEDEQSHCHLRINGVSSNYTAVIVFWMEKQAQWFAHDPLSPHPVSPGRSQALLSLTAAPSIQAAQRRAPSGELYPRSPDFGDE